MPLYINDRSIKECLISYHSLIVCQQVNATPLHSGTIETDLSYASAPKGWKSNKFPAFVFFPTHKFMERPERLKKQQIKNHMVEKAKSRMALHPVWCVHKRERCPIYVNTHSIHSLFHWLSNHFTRWSVTALGVNAQILCQHISYY